MSNPLNKISQVYLDQVANIKKIENEDDVNRWTQTEAVKGEDSQRRKDAAAERRSGTVGGVKTPKRLSPSKGRDYVKGTKASIDWWKNRKKVNEGKSWKDFKQAMKSAVKKKNAPKHDYGRDAGAEAKKRLKKKDHETVNFLDPDD